MPRESLFERMSAVQSAHARSTDPLTSHEAALAITPGLPELQALVERIALQFPDGFTDVDLIAAGEDNGGSTLRTRRAELTARNIILDSGGRVIPEGHTQRHTIWIHRSFVPDAPPVCAAARPASSDEKRQGLALAVELESGARQMRAEGRGPFAEQLAEAARLMRILAA